MMTTMSLSAAVLATALATTGPATDVVEQHGVRVEVHLRAQDYRFDVTNVDAPPLTQFEVHAYHTYNHIGPEGWTVELGDDWTLRCVAEEPRYAIGPGSTKRFSLRVGSSTATLGRHDAIVRGGSGPAEFSASLPVWSPVRHPRSYIATIAFTLIGIALVHGILVWRKPDT
jgi:hypothetical protein